MTRAFSTGLALAAAAALFVAPEIGEAPATAQRPSMPPAACPDKIGPNVALTCYCDDEATATGTVWGSDVYTDDSKICRAALHAGVIGAEGGMIRVRAMPGRQGYPAVTRNSVASDRWGAWNRSFAFIGGGAQVDAGYPAVEACPVNATGYRIGAAVSCGCPAGIASGAVWGSGPYTADSIMCRAAVHAGVIGSRGGPVRVLVQGPRPGFAGSTRNGVATSNWGRYDKSYVFVR